jgi:hypothetical protein
MNRSESAQALSVAAAYDNRTIGETNVMAWADALADLRLTDVIDAIKAHYRDTTEFVQPAHIRPKVRNLRDRRIMDAVIPAPPAELADDPVAALEWHRAALRAIADGEPLVERRVLSERPVQALVEGQSGRWGVGRSKRD